MAVKKLLPKPKVKSFGVKKIINRKPSIKEPTETTLSEINYRSEYNDK